MSAAPLPSDDAARVARLHRIAILDTPPEQAYDDLTEVASTACDAPMALVSLVDATRQWNKARVGFDAIELPRDVSFCAHAIAGSDDVFVVEDASLDPRFATNPLVSGGPHLRFYAGALIVMPDGRAVGTVCVMSARPRRLDDAQRRSLAALARQAATLFDWREDGSSGRTTHEHRPASIGTRLRRMHGEALRDLVLQGDRMSLWELHVPSGAWSVDERGLAMLGYGASHDTDGPSSPGTLEDAVHPDDWPSLIGALDPRRDDDAATIECTHRLKHREGRWIWVHVRAVVVERDMQGGPVRIVGTHLDISARKADELALASATDMLARTGALAHVGGWEIDAATRRVRWSDEVDRIHEIDGGGEVNGDRVLEMYEPASRSRLVAAIESALRDGTPFDLELVLVTGKQRTIMVHAMGAAERIDGRIARIFGAVQDITDRKQVEDALIASERRVRTITDNLPALIAHIDREQRYTFANAPLRRRLALEEEDIIGRPLEQVRGDAMYRLLAPRVEDVLQGQSVTFEDRTERPGKPFHFQAHFVPDVGPDGRVNGFYAMTLDITARKLAEAHRAETDERLRGITDHLPALIVELDTHRHVRFCNGTYRSWLGIDPETAVGRDYADVIGGTDFAMGEPFLEQAMQGERVSFEQTMRMPTGEHTLHTAYVPHFDADGRVAGVYGMTSDISELKVIEQRLDALARIDSLTGLANRRQLEERLVDAMARTRRTGIPMAVLYLDIDRFKSVNDSFGHAGGDEVLKEFADRLNAAVRETDVVARLAGDEFVVILENVRNDGEAYDTAQKVVAAMRAPFTVQGRPHAVTTSAGVATFAAGDQSVAVLLSTADAALYAAKSYGRDRVHVAGVDAMSPEQTP